MKKYVVYNLVTGEILRYGVCANVSFNKKAGPGEGVLEVEKSATMPDDIRHKVSGNKIVKKSSLGE